MIAGRERAQLAVGVAAYEEPRRIVVALAALLHQQGVDVRVRVFDDSRSDDVAAAVAPLLEREPRLEYRRNPERLGLALNCHRAMRWAAEHGEFCSIGSDHDEVQPGWANRLIDALERVPSAVLASPLVRRLDADGREIDPRPSPVEILHPSPLVRAVRAVDLPRVGDLIYGISRREFFERIPFHPAPTSDRLAIVQAMSLGGVVHVPRVLYHRVDQERRARSTDLAARQRESMALTAEAADRWWIRNAGLLLAGGFSRPPVTGPVFATVAASAYLRRYVRRAVLRARRRSVRLFRSRGSAVRRRMAGLLRR